MSAAPSGGDADTALGAVVRARRHALGKTLVEVAAASELSHSFLSQLERGLARPSMRSLFLIAEALDTTQQSLLAAATPAGAAGGTAGGTAGAVVDLGASPGTAGSARLVSHVEEGADVTEFINLPDSFEGYFSHGRHELVYVVSGHLEVELGSSTPGETATELFSLTARQSIGYPGATPHRHRRVGPEQCVVLVVHSGPADVAASAGSPPHTH